MSQALELLCRLRAGRRHRHTCFSDKCVDTSSNGKLCSIRQKAKKSGIKGMTTWAGSQCNQWAHFFGKLFGCFLLNKKARFLLINHKEKCNRFSFFAGFLTARARLSNTLAVQSCSADWQANARTHTHFLLYSFFIRLYFFFSDLLPSANCYRLSVRQQQQPAPNEIKVCACKKINFVAVHFCLPIKKCGETERIAENLRQSEEETI